MESSSLLPHSKDVLRSRITKSMVKTRLLFPNFNPYFHSTANLIRSSTRSNVDDDSSIGIDMKPVILESFSARETGGESCIVKFGDNAPDLKPKQVSREVVSRRAGGERVPVPQWHAPWELAAVISGHLGWVRSIAFDSSNEWFVTGSADRTIKVWDLAKCCAGAEGGLKLTLTGHISAVRGLAVSPRHPYLFSAGEDKMVKCWDLEYNKVIRHYHGHLSGVYSLTLHPTLDIMITGGRDSVARVWDIRTKHQIHVLGGHTNTVGTIVANSVDPQVITGSNDATIKLWDLVAGKAMSTLTQHKKIRKAYCHES